jgi:molybdate transport system permease protein
MISAENRQSLWFEAFMAFAAALFAVCVVMVFWTFFSRSSLWGNLSIFLSEEVRSALFISLQTSLTVVGVTFIAGLPIAYILAVKDFKGKVIIDSLIDLPIIFPPLVSGLALLMLLGPDGAVGEILEKFDLRIVFSKTGIIIAQTFVAAPFFIKTVRESIASIPANILSASYTLRASRSYTFFHVILPLSKNGLCAGLIMCWARALGEFGATAMLAGCIPGKTETMTLAIYSKSMSGDFNTATAIAVMLTVFAFISLVVMKNVFRKYENVAQA